MRKILISSLLFFSACSGTFTEPGRTTAVGAAAGGALGAGIGAIVGSQVGAPGGGIAIGAAAGAAAGGAIGNMLEAQEQQHEKKLAVQDHAINEHSQTIAEQQQEINQLRSGALDTSADKRAAPAWTSNENEALSVARARNAASVPGYRQEARDLVDPHRRVAPPPVVPVTTRAPTLAPAVKFKTEATAPETTSDSLAERDLTVAASPNSLDLPGVEETKAPPAPRFEPQAKPETVIASAGALHAASPDCAEAEVEAGKASAADEASDKLFHYRRALRLCPTHGEFHNGLGEVYLTLGRREDAEFEFKEALRLDPTLQAAENNLAQLNAAGEATFSENVRKY